MDTLTFDIETIPMQGELSDTIKDEVTRKVEREVARSPELANDLESLKNRIMATSPYFGEIVAIGLHMHSDLRGTDVEVLIGTEEEILTRFWNIIKNFRGTYVSYNGIGFDVPFIVKRSMRLGIRPTNSDFMNTRRFSRHPHFDAQLIISDWDRYSAPTLKLACDHMGIPSPKEGEIAAADVYPAFLDGKIKEIADYCERDIVATYELYKKLSKY